MPLATALLVLASAFELSPASAHLRVDGDSTLHAWSVETRSVKATARVDPSLAASDVDAALRELLDGEHAVSMELRVPVATLRSNESQLDANLRKAMRQKKHPEIVFRLDRLRAEATPDGYRLKAAGRLEVAGEERPITLELQGRVVRGELLVSGAVDLKMTDFKVEPPVLLLGAIRTADAIKVSFEMTWKPQPTKKEEKS
jgi:polyisoprenoid-binding protein YceI